MAKLKLYSVFLYNCFIFYVFFVEFDTLKSPISTDLDNAIALNSKLEIALSKWRKSVGETKGGVSRGHQTPPFGAAGV